MNRNGKMTTLFGLYGPLVFGALTIVNLLDTQTFCCSRGEAKVPELVASDPMVRVGDGRSASPSSPRQRGVAPAPAPLQSDWGKLLSLRLVPHDVSLWGARASHRFLVLGKYADELERDVTSQSHFTLSDSALADVDKAGKVVALGDGEVLLTAEFGGRSAVTKIRIEGLQEKKPFSFARDICTIFTKRGCNNSACHGSVKGRGGFKLSMDSLDPKEDYRWITQGGIFAVLTVEPAGPKPPRIDLKDPEKSLLLLKPTLSVSHGGGLRFAKDSPDYRTILNWVRSGAPYGEGAEKIANVEVYPREVFLDPQGNQQLLVTA